jgi:hypothetical protein
MGKGRDRGRGRASYAGYKNGFFLVTTHNGKK